MQVRIPTLVLAIAVALARPAPGALQGDVPLLSRCHYHAEPDTVRALPVALHEISGLALHRGLLLAHDDELGRVYSINPASGAVAVMATLQGPIRDDFEGIAVLGDTIWLMTSAGRLYGVRARATSTPAPFVLRQTGIGKRCELEGLAADETNGVLLLPCKILPKNAGGLVVYRWDVARGEVAVPATISAAAGDLKRAGGQRMRPTAVEMVPRSNHLMLLSSIPPALVEVGATGTVLGYASLGARHAQAEGLAIATNGDLYVSDEGGNGLATLSIYRCRP